MEAIEVAVQSRGRGRPRKDQSQPDAPRARLLRQGVTILTEKGFSAVGIDEILATAGVPKGSFYHYFDSKEDFGLALLDYYDQHFLRKLDRWFLDEGMSPLDRFRAFIADAREIMERFEFRRSCLVGHLGQEMGVLPESFRHRLIKVLEGWEERTAGCFRAAQQAGEVPVNIDCEKMARFFWIGWEGAVLRARLECDPVALDVFSEGFLEMLTMESVERKK
ncbi:TetR family transcriptional regulator [Dietzia sp. CQ4]|uniref:acrylate utilization transcriptional regulator AcuR n=1 Tax=Dietzia sp. (strain CQ4) TaxID=370437 RepID=UPI0015FB825F|nr:TetR/AcrR family transcriptional regulator [Dietzia sp. CQ4]MBB1034918.1 TetR family transcriptional regulator [Dietzia sp. CQ4]